MQVWAPSHATLFFSTPERIENPSHMGSMGGGLNFNHGIITEINLNGDNSIKWNGVKIDGRVTLSTLKRFEEITGKQTGNIDIDHYSEIPIGHGLSTSGAGSIGSAIALDSHFNTQLDKTEIYEIAHYADIVNHTGLGSVVGQIIGGIELRLSQGGPKTCKTKKFESNEELLLIFFGPLSTSDVLTSENQMKLVTSAGIKTLDKIKLNNNVDLANMILAGKNFTTRCGLLTRRIEHEIKIFEKLGEKLVTMAMIGETIILKPNNLDKMVDFLNENNYNYLKTRISNEEPKILT